MAGQNKINGDMGMEGCTLCPRECRADRTKAAGFCGMGDEVTIARAALHMWEEPCISGECGSGTVFFSGCTLRCVFCQNYQISTQKKGYKVSVERLADIFLELEALGAWNINLVTPTHFVPQIIRALELGRAKGLSLPVVYNTSGYETVETLKRLEGHVDIYLPDFKYTDPVLAGKYSGAPAYFFRASKALEEMVRQVPKAVFDGSRMVKGVIVRHLMLPGCLLDSKKAVRYLYETWGDSIYMSLMNQYTPLPSLSENYPELNVRVQKKAYNKLIQFALDLGVSNAFIQEGETAKESFIPDFDGKGVYGQGKIS